MKTISLLIILMPVLSFCQTTGLPKLINDTLYTSTGYAITVGQQIELGAGTRDNGDFKYITVSHNSWLTGPNVRQASMRRTSNYRTAVVKKIKTESKSKNAPAYFIVVGTGDIVNYECDVEHAIAAGEIRVPDKYKPNATQQVSVADELAKLKKLYDDSVITKEEFKAQKKKLLKED